MILQLLKKDCIIAKNYVAAVILIGLGLLLASGDNRHSGSGEKRQFWSNEKRHLQIE